MLTTGNAVRTVQRVWLTMRAWVALMAFDVALLAGFAHVHERVKRCQVRTPHRTFPRLREDVIWAVDEACVWYVKRAACLQRSAVAAWLLRRSGIPADLVIGYRPIPFESHAWVEVGGEVVNDRPQYQKAFTVLDRF